MKRRLTDLAVERLQAPPEGRLELWDTLLPGFGLRVTSRGKKSWVAMYRLGGRGARKQRITLGSYPALSLAAAREQARDIFAQVSAGRDPSLKIRELMDADTFETVAAEFIERYAKPKNRGWKKQESEIKNTLLPRWKRRKINTIT
ncbi:MAG: DUF4102 domain-containing protein, partial [Alphaproteobacteria bacterium]|nr:DUF4102 domain-containing protein [Alphaproteobacteria bacterium]